MNTPPVAYVIRMFPQLSETFIANEIRALESAGLEIEIYSYRRPTSVVSHECVRSVRAPITYLPDPLYRHPWALLRANRGVQRLEPVRYRRTVEYLFNERSEPHEQYTWRRFLHAVALAHALKASAATHIHAHMAHSATRVAMLASMLTGLPFSFSAHARDLYTADPAVLVKKVAAAEFVLTCTRAAQEYLRSLLALDQQRKVKLAYHGIDLRKFTPRDKAPATALPIILSVGRLVEKKGFDCLLRACRILKDDGAKFRCHIVGDGPQKSMLDGVIRELGLGDVARIIPSRTQEQLLEEYLDATVFALPCQILEDGDRDGIPNVLLEAMAVGIPVVSSAVSGVPEVVRDGHSGLLTEERNPVALAEALHRLLGSTALRAQMAHNARQMVARDFDSWANGRRLAVRFQGRATDRAGRMPGEQPGATPSARARRNRYVRRRALDDAEVG
jgi:glycosyltransferase involved in cell wall biosynthesis